MEGRMRCSNIPISNVPETPGSNTPTADTKLLREALKMDEDVLIDRCHCGRQPQNQDGKPCVIMAKVYYYHDIIRRAQESGPLWFKGNDISIFLLHPRSAVTEARQFLR